MRFKHIYWLLFISVGLSSLSFASQSLMLYGLQQTPPVTHRRNVQYRLQLASFHNLHNAIQYRNRIAKMITAPVSVLESKTSIHCYRVTVGPLYSVASWALVRQQLLSKTMVSTKKLPKKPTDVTATVRADTVTTPNVPSLMTMERITPFVSLEGSATWLSMRNFNFKTPVHSAVLPDNVIGIWGGRIAGGMAIPFRNNFYFTGETGWNSVGTGGHSQAITSTSDYSFSGTIQGPDLLIGTAYQYKNMGFYLKAGTFIESLTYRLITKNFDLSLLSTPTKVNAVLRGAHVNVMPEIKVGLDYDINRALAISLGYMHTFGNNVDFKFERLSPEAEGGGSVINIQTDTRGTTLNAVLLGLRYNFK